MTTIKAQQARRRELHAMTTTGLRKVYVRTTGHLMHEVRSMFHGLHDDGRQIMVDAIVRHETVR